MSKSKPTPKDVLSSREKHIFKTLDVFSHGVNSGKSNALYDEDLGVTETSHQDIQITFTNTVDEMQREDAVNGNTQEWIQDTLNGNDHSWDQSSEHHQVCLQTGAKLYHGKDKSTEDEVEESILRFLQVPSYDHDFTYSESVQKTSVLKEVECYIWYPDDDRRDVCKEALDYFRRGVGCHGIKIKEQHVDLSHFNLDFPVIIICLPPRQPEKISLGDMPVALVLIGQCDPSVGKDTPLSDDLYWRRYKNLSLIVDLKATNDSFEDTKININSVKLLSEFLQPL